MAATRLANPLRLATVVLALVAALAVFSCGGEGGGSPSGVVKAFYAAVNAGDWAKAEALLSPGQRIVQDDSRRHFAGKIAKVEIVDEQVGKMLGAEVATVTVKVTLAPGGPSELMALQLVRGRYSGAVKVLLEKQKAGWRIVDW